MTATFYTVLAIIAFLAAVIVPSILSGLKKGAETQRREAEARAERARKQSLVRSQAGFNIEREIIDGSKYLYSDANKWNFLYAELAGEEIKSIIQFTAQHIIAVDFVPGAKVITTETVTNHTSKKKGGLTRAAVGGVALGGVGAIVGAATAGSVTSGCETSTSAEMHQKGHFRLSTTSPQIPIIQLFVGHEKGKKWAFEVNHHLNLRNHMAHK